MAYRRKRGGGSRRFSAGNRAARSRGRRAFRGGGRGGSVVRLVIQQGPAAAAPAIPGVAGVSVQRDHLAAMTPPAPGRARF